MEIGETNLKTLPYSTEYSIEYKHSRPIVDKGFSLRSVNGYFHDSNYERIAFRPAKFLNKILRNSKKILNILFSLSGSCLKLNDINLSHAYTIFKLVISSIKTLSLVVSNKAYKLLVTTSYIEKVGVK